MSSTLENLGQLERKVDISLPNAEIDSEVQTRLKRLARDVRMDGFRPGKVPLAVVTRQYGEQVRREVVGDALQKNLGEVVRQNNLRVAGYPKIENKGASGGTQAEFTVTFEVYPDLDPGDISSCRISRPQVVVGDTEVNKTLDIMRKQRTRFDSVDRPAAPGDRVVIDFVGRIGGAEFEGGKGHDVAVVLGEGRLLKDFEDHVVGLSVGAGRSFELRFPDDYHGKEIAGKSATFDVTLKKTEAPSVPALDADFARSLGVADGSLEVMRKEIKENLEREVSRRIESRVKEQVMQALIDTNKIAVPKSLIEIEIDNLSAAARSDLVARGVKVDNAPIPRDIFQQQAERRVTLGLILGEVVRRFGLQPKPEQVRKLVETQAQTYEQPQEVVNWFYKEPQRLRDMETLALEENVVSWALSKAQITDDPVEFDELMGAAK